MAWIDPVACPRGFCDNARRVAQMESSKGEAAPAGQEGGGETARTAGRGGLAIAGAKVAFILFGISQQIFLPRLLHADGYGQVRTVMAIVSIVNNTVVAMSIQGVSRAVSSAPAGREDEALRATLSVHVVVAMLVSLAFALLAGTIAQFEGAPYLTAPLRLVAAVVLLYGLYAPLVGALNGRRRFLAQAGLDTIYGALRTLGLAGGAVLFPLLGGDGVFGALAGFVAAAVLILPAALSRVGVGRAGDSGPSVRSYLSFLLPVAGGQILLNLLLFTDGLLLRRFAGPLAPSYQDADTLTGVYSGAQQFSFLPYQLLMSVTFVLFPMLARAQADGDQAAVRSFTRGGVRIAMLLTALITGTISGLAPHVLRVMFPSEMWGGSDALRVLSLGMGSLSVLGITCAALTSLGRAIDSALLTLLGVVLIAAGCTLFVRHAPFGPPMLVTTATVTAVALTTTAVVGAIRLRAVAGGFVAPLTLVRALAVLGACVAVGSRLPWIGKPGTVLEAGLVAAFGLVLLIVLGELGREDLARLKAVVGRRK
jgi:stage V sporulation protein B